MASGCIVALNCPVCGEIVWEDEWDIIGDDIFHQTCRREYIKRKYPSRKNNSSDFTERRNSGRKYRPSGRKLKNISNGWQNAPRS
jgi:hypothetical protein